MELKNSYWEITILPQAGEPEPHWNDPLLQSSAANPNPGLLDVLRGVKGHCDLVELKVTRITGVRYSYEFEHSDARMWNQELRLGTDLLSTEINFTVPSFWRLDELRGHRADLLGKIIELLLAYPTESIEVEWL